jgi:hypothetical protein
VGDFGVYVAPTMSDSYIDNLDLTVESTVTRGPEVTDYAIVLIVNRDGRTETIRVYDGAHGHNEMHRYSPTEGKQSGVAFHSGTIGKECVPRSRTSSVATGRWPKGGNDNDR